MRAIFVSYSGYTPVHPPIPTLSPTIFLSGCVFEYGGARVLLDHVCTCRTTLAPAVLLQHSLTCTHACLLDPDRILPFLRVDQSLRRCGT